jgi:hypothetical protein
LVISDEELDSLTENDQDQGMNHTIDSSRKILKSLPTKTTPRKESSNTGSTK